MYRRADFNFENCFGILTIFLADYIILEQLLILQKFGTYIASYDSSKEMFTRLLLRGVLSLSLAQKNTSAFTQP